MTVEKPKPKAKAPKKRARKPPPAEPSEAVMICRADPVEGGYRIGLRVFGFEGTVAHATLDQVAAALAERLPALPAEPKRGAS